MHDGVIFTIGRTSYHDNIRVQTDDVVGTYDVIIRSATEADQGLYQCQAVPSGSRATTYLWVDGKTPYILTTAKLLTRGRPTHFFLFRL